MTVDALQPLPQDAPDPDAFYQISVAIAPTCAVAPTTVIYSCTRAVAKFNFDHDMVALRDTINRGGIALVALIEKNGWGSKNTHYKEDDADEEDAP